MAGSMSAHTGVGVRALAASQFGVGVETEMIAAQPVAAAATAGAAPRGGLKRWGPAGDFAQAVEVPPTARLLFSSGIVGKRSDGTLPDSAADQCDQVYGASPAGGWNASSSSSRGGS